MRKSLNFLKTQDMPEEGEYNELTFIREVLNMAVNIRQDLKFRYAMISQSIYNIENKINRLPEGRIKVKNQDGKAYYYHAGIYPTEKYLGSKDIALIEELIQKNYLKLVLKEARNELAALEKMQKIYPDKLAEDVFDSLPDAKKKYATPINICDDAFVQKWLDIPYKRKPIKKGTPAFQTLKGDKVRSKSEVIIADRLWANGIPYKYECPLKTGNEIIHPDFTILRMSDRKIIYHEHCGRMDDPTYTDDLLYRVSLYSQERIFIGDRLYLTFESSTRPLNTDTLDDYINTNFK